MPSASTLFYLAVAIFASAPAWIVRHPPLQDLPFHIATIRVIHDFGDPVLHFQDDYDLNVFHTSYVGYYLAGSFLAYFLGAYKANIALMSLYLGGTPLALRELLKALKKDERLCLFAVPLGVNVMFMYGLLPFVIGFPIMFLAMAYLVRDLEKPTRNTAIIVAVLGVVLFYAHVLPFFLFGVAYIAFFPWEKPHKWIRAGLPAIPSVLLAIWWAKGSDAGHAAGHGGASEIFKSPPLDASFSQILQWSTNIFSDQSDEKWLLLQVIAAIIAIGLSQGERDTSSPLSRRFWIVTVVCIAGFVGLSDHLGDVWLLAQRFPIPGLLCAIPLLRMPRDPIRGAVATLAILYVCFGSIVNTCKHFIQFELDEVGDVDDAIAAIEPGKRVCGLIYDKGSAVVPNSPFLHFVSYVQAEKGGLVMFSYAGFPHWPFQYKPGHFPPPGRAARLRWEWTPEQTPFREIYPYYDYVLERGNGFRPSGGYHEIFHRDRWRVWKRD